MEKNGKNRDLCRPWRFVFCLFVLFFFFMPELKGNVAPEGIATWTLVQFFFFFSGGVGEATWPASQRRLIHSFIHVKLLLLFFFFSFLLLQFVVSIDR